MAKGKEALAAARRREREATEAAEALKAELRTARDENVRLNRLVTDQTQVISELARLRQQINEGTSDEVQALTARNHELVQTVTELQASVQHIQELWDRVSSAVLDSLGGTGTKRIEELGVALDLWESNMTIAWSPAEEKLAKKYGTEASRRIQRARGERVA